MLGISRWAGKGGSYRTVQRFFHSVIPWAKVFWLFFRQHLLKREEVYLLAGDECVVSKSGKQTHGLDRFFSSLYGKPIAGLSFFALSLISIGERRSHPIMIEQIVRTAAEKVTAKARAQAKKAKPKQKKKGMRGRPKGRQNRDKTKVSLSAELKQIQAMLKKLMSLTRHTLSLGHVVMDGKFGHNNALQMVRQCALHLISKLRHDAALYFPYAGLYAGRGPHRKYGNKVDCHNIPTRYLKRSMLEKHIQTDIYQAQMLHRQFAQPLNVVIIVKTHLKTRARAHVILFSSDLNLSHTQIIDYYSLRFQIEFNFRDAKQYWGLEDFMNIKQTAVTNAANLSLFMVNVTYLLMRPFRSENANFGVLDLKAHFRGHKYVAETIKWLPQKPEPILMAQILNQVSRLGGIHNVQPRFNTS